MLQLHLFGKIRWVNQLKHPTLFFPFLIVFLFSKLPNTSPNLMETNGWLVISQVKPPTWNDKKSMKVISLQFAKLENLCKLIQWGLLTTLTNKVSTRILLLIISIPCSNHIVTFMWIDFIYCCCICLFKYTYINVCIYICNSLNMYI